MPLQGEERKLALIESVAAMAEGAKGEALSRVIRQFYAHVPPEDLLSREQRDLFGAAKSLWEFAQRRKPGTATLRVFNPREAEEGWHSPRTIVEIVNDDMPFLVDSVTAALNNIDLIVHLVIHPIFRVKRDGKGKVAELLDGD